MTAEARNISIDNLVEFLEKEGVDIEFKEASFALPKSMWETVSVFANTNGGVLVLGVAEKNHTFTVTGVSGADRMESDFWNTIRNPKKISSLSLSTAAFEITEFSPPPREASDQDHDPAGGFLRASCLPQWGHKADIHTPRRR